MTVFVIGEFIGAPARLNLADAVLLETPFPFVRFSLFDRADIGTTSG